MEVTGRDGECGGGTGRDGECVVEVTGRDGECVVEVG